VSTAEVNLGSPGSVNPALLAEVKAFLSASVLGLPYLFARSSYANELTLHFGAERTHNHPKLAKKVRGTHVLSVRGSAWMLLSGIKPAVVGCGVYPTTAAMDKAKPFNVTALESGAGALIGQKATVSKATPLVNEQTDAVGLSVELSDGSRFVIIPTALAEDGDDLPEPADWELLTPDKLLRVGPGAMYSIDDN
jgi:hypothetical protein